VSRPSSTTAARQPDRDAARPGILTIASLTIPDFPARSAWRTHAPFAFWLVETLSPKTIVELGVWGGFSYFTLCQAAGLYAPSAVLVGIDTWEGDEHSGPAPPDMKRHVEARNERFASRSTLVTSTFDAALDRFTDGEIDLLHIDGGHTYETVRHDFVSWLPKLSSTGVVLLHDTEEHERDFGVWRLMDELETEYPTFRFVHGHGLGVVGVGSQLPAALRALFDAADTPDACRVVREVYALLGWRVGTSYGATAHLEYGRLLGEGTDRLRESFEARARMRRAESRAKSTIAAMQASHSWRVTAPLRASVGAARHARKVVRRAVGAALPVNRESRRDAETARRQREYETGSGAYANWVRDFDTLDAADRAGMKELEASLPARPLISIVMPVFNPDVGILERALESVLGQEYANWQLCIADDGSTDPAVRPFLESCSSRDPRIDVLYRDENGGIAAASNSALELVRGEIVTLLDQDDLLRPHSLLLVAQRMSETPEVGYVYSDEDLIDEGDRRLGHHYFKPDWNPELFRSQNYLCHLAAFRADLARLVGGFRTEFEGSQDWDLALRITELLREDQIVHIPHVLYHWRAAAPSSAASDPYAKPYALRAGRAAVTDHLRRAGIAADVVPADIHVNVRYAVPGAPPLVSVVVPTTMEGERFETLVHGLSGTDYRPIEVIRVATRAAIDAAPLEVAVPSELSGRDVPYDDDEFNFSRAVNLGCAAASGPLVLLVNDDLEVLHADWLRLMVGHVLQAGVAAVGALLLYPSESVQHAGVLLGAGHGAAHLYLGATLADHGYSNRLRLNQDLSCVTAACALLRKEAFDQVGGFDESLAVAYNDVDFCLRLRRAGWRIVFTPEAVLFHHESASFGSHSKGRQAAYDREVAELQRRWGPVLRADPSHNPNLALDSIHPGHLAFPPRVQYPWREARAAAAETS
jgi:GT2 family glycosyltransferase